MLDRASVLAAKSLRLPDEGTVLDACAAPGGKTLVIASAMGAGVRLLANELSSERRRRLSNVLDEHLGVETRERVTVSGFDAAALGGRKGEHGRFGAVLLDAPCSSERHVLSDPKALGQWTAARPRSLAQRQWALLSGAFLLLKAGGSLVYATCALSTEENDGVAWRLLKKYGAAVELDAPDFSEGEQTEYGKIILPDVSLGIGPMYVARFRKAVV
jgi:16S rRNA (cytosine1407-C5)-methyltransferase